MANSPAPRLLANAPLVVAVLLLVDSLHFVFARLLRPFLPPMTSALFVLGVALVETAVFLGLRRQIRWSNLRQHAPCFGAIGLLVALSTTLNYTAVRYIDAGTASMLAQTSTVFALALGVLWLRERFNRQEAVGALVAVVGVFVISFQPGDFLRLGSLLVLVGAGAYALHAAVVKRYGEEIEFGNFFLFRVGSTTLFLLLFNLGSGSLSWPGGPAWPYLLLAGTVDVVISRVLYYLALRRLRMSFHALLLTLSPVIAVLWSLALFGERPSLQGLLGGAAVIAGVLVVSTARRRAKKTPKPDA